MKRASTILLSISSLAEGQSKKTENLFIITTDHGRSHNPKSEWKSHGKTFEGFNAIWIAVLGPDTPPLGEVKLARQWWQNQIAKTAAAFLGLDYENKREEVGKIIVEMLYKD